MTTNKEFYGNKLLAVALSGNCRTLYRMLYGEHCVGLSCRDCEFGITEDNNYEKILQWLNAEHEEQPRLENGNDLKPGDWIMVRNSETCYWDKLQFMCYYNSMFYCVENRKTMEEYSYLIASGWKQARLPMEGE